MWNRLHGRRVLCAVAILVLTAPVLAAGCAQNQNTSTQPADDVVKPFKVTFAGEVPGPAPDVAGAKEGGVITALTPQDFTSLDPNRWGTFADIWVSELILRQLTWVRDTPGGLEVVGDLATNSGEMSDGGKTWKYTLRDGIKYEDGRPITSRDIAYGLARGFAPELVAPGNRLYELLTGTKDYAKVYSGPYEGGGGDIPPGVEVPDDKTIIFRLHEPELNFPYIVAVAPVPKDKDTRDAYGNKPVATGPYRVDEYIRGSKLTLKPNPSWDPNTDPLRHQYVDGFDFKIGLDPNQITERLIADRGPDQTATTWIQVAPELIPRVAGDPAVKNRVTERMGSNIAYMWINTKRVTDVDTRRALNYAVDRSSFAKAYGGPAIAIPGSTILSPFVPGYVNYNAYDGGPTGDPAKAKQLLDGKSPPTLTLTSDNLAPTQRRAVALKNSLERAGFQVKYEPLNPQSFSAEVAKPDNKYDLILAKFGGFYVNGGNVIETYQTGDFFNFSQLSSPDLDAQINETQHLEQIDRDKAVKAWADLDRDIMEKYAPVVPLTYLRTYTLSGSRVGGLYVSYVHQLPTMVGAYVK
jgi:peptide/nickel transport system substrate-binding protein